MVPEKPFISGTGYLNAMSLLDQGKCLIRLILFMWHTVYYFTQVTVASKCISDFCFSNKFWFLFSTQTHAWLPQVFTKFRSVFLVFFRFVFFKHFFGFITWLGFAISITPKLWILSILSTQPASTCSKLTIETQEQAVKYVQS